jgi:hypothetical protein
MLQRFQLAPFDRHRGWCGIGCEIAGAGAFLFYAAGAEREVIFFVAMTGLLGLCSKALGSASKAPSPRDDSALALSCRSPPGVACRQAAPPSRRSDARR